MPCYHTAKVLKNNYSDSKVERSSYDTNSISNIQSKNVIYTMKKTNTPLSVTKPIEFFFLKQRFSRGLYFRTMKIHMVYFYFHLLVFTSIAIKQLKTKPNKTKPKTKPTPKKPQKPARLPDCLFHLWICICKAHAVYYSVRYNDYWWSFCGVETKRNA